MRYSRGLGLLPVLLLALICACSSSSDGGLGIQTPQVNGSGVIVSGSHSMTGCTEIVLGGEGNLHIVQGANEELRIETDDNILPHIVVDLNAGTLLLRTAAGTDIVPTQLDYYLTVVDPQRISLTGVGQIEMSGLSGASLSVSLTGVGRIELLQLDLQQLDVFQTGVGDVELSGQVVDQTVSVTGTGSYDAAGLSSLTAIVNVAGIASATVCVSDDLTVTRSGTGSFSYYGDPVLHGDVTVADRLGLVCP